MTAASNSDARKRAHEAASKAASKAASPSVDQTLADADPEPFIDGPSFGDYWPPDEPASEPALGCGARNPAPPHQRCGKVVCNDGQHRDFPNDPATPETRWSDPAPASEDAGPVLTEDERNR